MMLNIIYVIIAMILDIAEVIIYDRLRPFTATVIVIIDIVLLISLIIGTILMSRSFSKKVLKHVEQLNQTLLH
jgi:hypothetical protein